jgi:tetratricopeptide (TPR) repeat protein
MRFNEVAGLLKAAGIEPEEGDGNLGMTNVAVLESDVPKAMKVLLEWRSKDAEACFIAADEMHERCVLDNLYQFQCGEGIRELSRGHYASAAGHLSTAVRLRPTSYQALYERACVRRHWGRIDDAKEDCQRILQLDPKTAYDPYQGHDEFKAKAAALLKELQD